MHHWKVFRAIFVLPWKMVSVSVRYVICFISQWMKRSKHGLFVPAKENPNMEKALFDWPIELQYDVKAKYRLISGKFSGMTFYSPERSLNQPKATRVCIRLINQSNRSICVSLLFLFCSRVLISRSYENRCNGLKWKLSGFYEFCSKNRAASPLCNRCVLCVA